MLTESPFSSMCDYVMEPSDNFQFLDYSLSSSSYCSQLPPPSPPPSPPKDQSPPIDSDLLNLLYSPCADNQTELNDKRLTDSFHQPYVDSATHYENDLVSLDRVSSYEDNLKYDDLLIDPLSSCSSDQMLPETPQLSCGEISSSEFSPSRDGFTNYNDDYISFQSEDTPVGKGKVSDLQRSALDSIFKITDRPSRKLVLYISSELHLHHVTVKNFFSNARRRVRRAAARLSDPERSRRENRRRKEKRRLAALAAANSDGLTYGDDAAGKQINAGHKGMLQCGEPAKEQTIISPQRRALMEKLADKVQRSAAQKNLANIGDSSSGNIIQPISSPNLNSTFIPTMHSVSSPLENIPNFCEQSPVVSNQCSWTQSLLNDALDDYPSDMWDMPILC